MAHRTPLQRDSNSCCPKRSTLEGCAFFLPQKETSCRHRSRWTLLRLPVRKRLEFGLRRDALLYTTRNSMIVNTKRRHARAHVIWMSINKCPDTKRKHFYTIRQIPPLPCNQVDFRDHAWLRGAHTIWRRRDRNQYT